MEKIAAANGLMQEGAFEKVVTWYDGYRFDPDGEKVINPVSFGFCAKLGRFQNYWANTAMTTFLTDALKKHPLDFSTIDIDQSALEAYEPDNPRIVTLLYQTGCLTIKDMHDYNGFRPAEEALAQIDERNYAEKYDFAGKTVRKLGISFSSEQRTITDVKVG